MWALQWRGPLAQGKNPSHGTHLRLSGFCHSHAETSTRKFKGSSLYWKALPFSQVSRFFSQFLAFLSFSPAKLASALVMSTSVCVFTLPGVRR